MRYTFLLPAYKSAYLAESISSILNQTFTDFNVIVSDDASPEPIKQIVDGFNDERIFYRRNPSNIGAEKLVDHWNLILEECRSEYVIMASDDDIYDSHFLEEAERLTRRYPELDLYSAKCRIINAEGNVVKEDPDWNELSDFPDMCNILTAPESILCIGNFIFRASALKKAGGFVDFPYAWKSDSATVLMMSGNGCARSSVPLFSFRMSGENISSRKESRTSCKGKIEAAVEFKAWSDRLLLSKGIDTTEIRKNISRKLEGEIRDYSWALSCKEFLQLYRKMLKENWFYTFRNKVSFLFNRFKNKKKDNDQA